MARRKVTLLPTSNKHVMMDERGRELFYHPERHEWLPGHKEKRAFVWDFHTGRFYDRPRPYDMRDGGQKRVRKTRYTYEFFHKYDAAPVGKNGRPYAKAVKTCRREVLFDGERLWQSTNVLLESGEWLDHTLAPFSGKVFDAYPEQSEEQGIPVVELFVNDGVPYSVVMDGERMDLLRDELPALYELLHMRGA